MSGPLEGLRVIDAGTRIAAPFCAGLLGELGAEVIKIEQPGAGDFMRQIGPFEDGYSLFWAVEGRGRKSATLDLRQPEGQELFRRLAATADVVCENFRPGTMEGWHIGPADLDPRLVMVRISVFGQDGPKRDRPGLDRMGIGYGGLMHLTGYPDQPPVRPGVTVSDYLTGTFAAHAALAALYRRDAKGGGKGSVIDASLYGSVLRILEWTLAAYDRLGTVRTREGNRLANSAPLDNYPTLDGKYVCVVAGSDQNFRRLCRAMQRPDLATDPRFATLAERARHGDEINGIVSAWTSSLPADDVEKACIATDVPVATAYTVADIFADEHMQARRDVVTVADPVLGAVRQQAPFPRFDGQIPEAPSGAPRLGEHNDEVWRGIIGLSAEELAGLQDAGVI
jgi:crotonobetainyl-CoA:carnitine CoA-transferase CaiB-like acyl-CoA transferase